MFYKINIFVLMLILLLAYPASASVTTTDVTIYSLEFTITKFELSKDNGATFVEVFSGNSEFNIGASTEATFQKKGTLTENVIIPDGIYNYARIYITATVPTSFKAVFPSHTYYTHAGGWSETGPADEQNLECSTTFYAASIPETEFSEGHRRTFYIYSYIGSGYASVIAADDYSTFDLYTSAAISIGDPEAIQSATPKTTNLITFTIKATGH